MSYECQFEDLDEHEAQSCGYLKGGILAIGVLKSGHNITDFEDETQWQDAITAGTARIIKGIKGTFPAASPVEGENPIACGSETVTDGFDYIVTWKDFNVSSNNDLFYGQLNRSAFSGLAIYYCQDEKIRVVEKSVNFLALNPESPESNKEKQMYNITAKWSAAVEDEFPTLYDAPTGIFTV
jgi:hypothetical protein